MSRIITKLKYPLNRLLKINTPQKQIIKHGSYKSSQFLEDIGKVNTKYEITKDPADWKFVENILPPTTIPEPIIKEEYPSGWKPQATNLQDRKYFIQRTKNHMIPVYLELSKNNTRRLTIIRNIQGDIWLLEKELTDYIKTLTFKPVRLQVNEFSGKIVLNGDYVNAIKYWLQNQGY